MKKIKDNYYKAKDGYTFKRTDNQKIYGRDLYLGEGDSIFNYEEVPYTEETKTDYDREQEIIEARGY